MLKVTKNLNNFYNTIFLIICYYIIASRIVIDRMTVQRILSKLSTIESKIGETDLKLSDIKGQVQKIEDRLKSEPNDDNVIAVNNYFIVLII